MGQGRRGSCKELSFKMFKLYTVSECRGTVRVRLRPGWKRDARKGLRQEAFM